MSRFSSQQNDSGESPTWIATGLPALRERILQNALVVSSIATAIIYFSQFYEMLEKHAWPRLVMLSVMLILLVTFTMLEKVKYRVRATVFLLALFIESLYQFITLGMNSDGRLFLLVFVILSSVFMERRQGIRVFLLAVLIVIAIRGMVLAGATIPGIDVRKEETSLLVEWVNGGVIFVMLGLLTQIANSTLVHHVENVLAANLQIREQLEQK
ncbi:MAG TPA: hypothetical protein VHO48_15865, partial [Anaerolineaceae bacterium]|nr:hypothetical protein [Anaerolineaceae bacterium]